MPLINKCGGSGDSEHQLCEQVETFTLSHGTRQAILNWTVPAKDQNSSFVGTRIVRKIGSCPKNPYDGDIIYEGTGFSYTDSNLSLAFTYYYRAFAYNAQKKYQNSMRFVSMIPVDGQRLSAIPVGSLVAIPESGVMTPFYVAKHDYQADLNGNGRTLLVRQKCYTTMTQGGSILTPYSNGNISKYLCGTYLNLFDSNIQKGIGTTSIYVQYGGSVPKAVFLLSACEMGGISALVSEDGEALPIVSTLKRAYYGSSYAQWFLRTQYAGGVVGGYHSYVDTDGDVEVVPADAAASDNGLSISRAIRPAFTLSGDTLFSLSQNSDGAYEIMT